MAPAYQMTFPAPRRSRYPARGMGDAAQDVAKLGGASSGVVTAAAAPAVASALGISAGLAIPIVGAAFAGVLLGVEALLNSGCGQTCVVTSQWANQAEPILRQNILTYFNLPEPRHDSDKQSALNVFDATWAGLTQRCSQPGLGDAGKNCIADRQSGACKWKQTADSPLLGIPGEPQPGACWNWFSGYRDPIANDPTVADTVETATSGAVASVAGSLGVSSSLVWLSLAALAAWAVLS
jgi:hypothetical protein